MERGPAGGSAGGASDPGIIHAWRVHAAATYPFGTDLPRIGQRRGVAPHRSVDTWANYESLIQDRCF